MWVEATVGCGLGNCKVRTEKSLMDSSTLCELRENKPRENKPRENNHRSTREDEKKKMDRGTYVT